jgi:hypothetical protein
MLVQNVFSSIRMTSRELVKECVNAAREVDDGGR